MSLDLSQRSKAITPSPTLTIDAKTKELIAAGADVVNLSAGEPDFNTPDQASLAGIAAISANFTKYTAVSGIVELRKEIAQKLRTENGLSYNPDEIIVSSGAKQSLYNIFMTILNPGDEVLLPAPYWVSYPEQIRLCEAVPIPLPTDEGTGFKITPDQLRVAITAKTKAILLNTPSNPTGAVYSTDEIKALAAVLETSSLWIVSDEIYEQLTYDVTHFSIACCSETLRNRTLVVNGFSKTHAMTGWRVGYVAGPKSVIAAMSSFQSHTTANPSSISQKAALGAMGTFNRSTVTQYRERRDFVLTELAKMQGITCAKPEGAFYVFPNAQGLLGKTYTSRAGKPQVIDSIDQFCELLLSEYHVSTVPGSGFGAPSNFRISYATSLAQLRKGLQRMSEFVGALTE